MNKTETEIIKEILNQLLDVKLVLQNQKVESESLKKAVELLLLLK